MAHRCRIIERADGSLAVIHPAPKSRRADETEASWLARVFDKAQAADPELAGRPFEEMDSDALPADRTQRHAWRRRAGRVVVDPTVTAPPTRAERRRQAIEQATTLADLKAALLRED